jgi:hypothetical protein
VKNVYNRSKKCYNLQKKIKDGVIYMSPVVEAKPITYNTNEENKANKNTSFAELRKRISKPSPFGRKLVDMYKQGR